MKRLMSGAALAMALLLPVNAWAVMGFLVRWETTVSVTGRLVYVCTYSVMGSEQDIIRASMCPQSMEFE